MKYRDVFSFQTFSWNSFSCILRISISILMLLSCAEYLIYANLSLIFFPHLYKYEYLWTKQWLTCTLYYLKNVCTLGKWNEKEGRLKCLFPSLEHKISTLHKNGINEKEHIVPYGNYFKHPTQRLRKLSYFQVWHGQGKKEQGKGHNWPVMLFKSTSSVQKASTSTFNFFLLDVSWKWKGII